MAASALNFFPTLNSHASATFARQRDGKSHRDAFNQGRSLRSVRKFRLCGIRSESKTFDVVIAGAGIIGLTIARKFLLSSNISVAVVDAAVPCSGATGAGQGYIWRVHKDPENKKWELSLRSHQLWEDFAESAQVHHGLDPLPTFGWIKTGSMLVGRTGEESSLLQQKVQKLVDAGLNARFLSHDDLMLEEPVLKIDEQGGAAFTPDDYQIDAKRAVGFIEKENRSFASENRYAEFYHDPVIKLLRSETTGDIQGVQTSKNTLFCNKAVVIATGSWSRTVVHDLLHNVGIELDLPIMPRKGHLLIVENFNSFKLNHGLMEFGYVNHESKVLGHDDTGIASVSMTATMDHSTGRVIFGSSRQLVGFNTQVEEDILNRIWERAAEFFPAMKRVSLRDLIATGEVRVGLRPYIPSGSPVISSVPGLPKMFIAAGHEGEGLSLALGTAEMVFNMIMDNPQEVNPAPFSLVSQK